MSWRDVIRGGTDLLVKQGTTWIWEKEVLDESGEAVDLTAAGFSANAQVRARPGAQAVLYEWDSELANCQLTEDGIIRLTLEPAESSEWTFKRAVWDLELIDPDGIITRIDGGRLIVSPEITRE